MPLAEPLHSDQNLSATASQGLSIGAARLRPIGGIISATRWPATRMLQLGPSPSTTLQSHVMEELRRAVSPGASLELPHRQPPATCARLLGA